MSHLAPLGKKNLPKPLPLVKLLGPSFVLLGMGLGSGELILWPYLSANFGLGIIWAALLGITFQFFLNMEIARYTLITGESIFVGLTRKYGRFSPLWFIFSTLTPWIWPGIIASAGTIFAASLGITYSKYIGIGLLIFIGMLYSMGSVVYKTQERIQKAIIMIGIPFIFGLTLFLAETPDWQALSVGLIGKGTDYWFLPAGIPIATFLAAFAYAGAGGNLNLAQSLYAKEKGYGMGKFSGRITNIIKGKPACAGRNEKITLEGNTFETNPKNLKRFDTWWRRINTEHAIVFWGTGAITMIFLSVLAHTTVFGNSEKAGIGFILVEAQAIASATLPAIGTLFLVVAGTMLFATQYAVTESNARIMSENLVIASPDKFKIANLPKYFYGFVWLQLLAGILIFTIGFTEPLSLIVLGAVLNAFSMFVYSGLILWLNMTKLEKPLRPSLIRIIMVSSAFLFYGGFSFYICATTLF